MTIEELNMSLLKESGRLYDLGRTARSQGREDDYLWYVGKSEGLQEAARAIKCNIIGFTIDDIPL